MTVHYQDERVTLHHGDCLDVLRSLPDASVDAVVTDPPYGLEFMGKEWDAPWKSSDSAVHADARNRRASEVTPTGQAHSTSAGPYLAAGVNKFAAGKPFQDWCELWATECLRVLKPGGHMLAFGGTRTWHRLAVAVEDAGFEVRDSIAWLYGSGFPKSLDVSKAIDKAAGAEREVTSTERSPFRMADKFMGDAYQSTQSGDSRETDADGYIVRKITAPATPDAERWQGWGTALKPAFEPVVVARKPLVGTVAANVLAHGTGALNIDGCRIEHRDASDLATSQAKNPGRSDTVTSGVYGAGRPQQSVNTSGRWPANVVLDELQAAALDEMSGVSVSRVREDLRSATPRVAMAGGMLGGGMPFGGHDDKGGASRFFYVAKAPKRERPTYQRDDEGGTMFAGSIRKRCANCGKQEVNVGTSACACPEPDFQPDPSMAGKVSHPTVKPLDLMRWLVRLVARPGGLVLDPFAGSGTTVEACIVEGFRCLAIEREPDYLPLILQRINRQRDPLEHTRTTGGDLALFELDGESA